MSEKNEKVVAINDVADLTKYIISDSDLPTKEFDFLGSSKIKIQALSAADKDFIDQFIQNNILQSVVTPGQYNDFWGLFGKTLTKCIKGWKDLKLGDLKKVLMILVTDENKDQEVLHSDKNVRMIFENSSRLSMEILQYASNRELFLMEDDSNRLNA